MNRKKRQLYVQEAWLANVCRNAAFLTLSKGWSILWHNFFCSRWWNCYLINTSLEWDFPWYVTPRLLTQATALTSCCEALLSAVTKEPAAVTCDVHSELYFYSSTVPGASVDSRVTVIKTMMIVMILIPSGVPRGGFKVFKPPRNSEVLTKLHFIANWGENV